MACLGAYDEFTTVRAYTACLPLYARLGPRFEGYVCSVIADEARHYHAFLDVARREWPERLPDLPAFLADLRDIEGTPYAATFVLDHDDPVFTEAICSAAERALMRHLR